MKNLFYSTALAGLILLAASCNKGDLVAPQKPIPPVPVLPPAHCDSVKLISYVLTNVTGNSTYEITFYGIQNYVFKFPPYGNRTISIKPGTYSISILTPDFDDYPLERFQLDNMVQQRESRAQYDNVVLAPCAGPHSVSITP